MTADSIWRLSNKSVPICVNDLCVLCVRRGLGDVDFRVTTAAGFG